MEKNISYTIINTNIPEEIEITKDFEIEFDEGDALYFLSCINQSIVEQKPLNKNQLELVLFLNENPQYILAMSNVFVPAIKGLQSNSGLFPEITGIKNIKELFKESQKINLSSLISQMLEKQKKSAGESADKQSQEINTKIVDVFNTVKINQKKENGEINESEISTFNIPPESLEVGKTYIIELKSLHNSTKGKDTGITHIAIQKDKNGTINILDKRKAE